MLEEAGRRRTVRAFGRVGKRKYFEIDCKLMRYLKGDDVCGTSGINDRRVRRQGWI